MNVVDRYFAAWGDHSPSGVVAAFADDGTYADPATGGPLSGEALAAYVAELIAAIPDVSFDLISRIDAGNGRTAAQWVMRGTNTGPVPGGLPPSGKTVTLPGADFIVVEGDAITSVQGYFDQKLFFEQLGLRVSPMPEQIGPFRFGSSVQVQTGKRSRPGAMSVTSLELRNDADVQRTTGLARPILTSLLGAPGFISAVTGQIGTRMFTVTAWEDADSPRQLLRGGPHRQAMREFFGPDYAVGGITSVWVPERYNTMWVRCATCGRMVDAHSPDGTCPDCGASLTQHPTYW